MTLLGSIIVWEMIRSALQQNLWLIAVIVVGYLLVHWLVLFSAATHHSIPRAAGRSVLASGLVVSGLVLITGFQLWYFCWTGHCPLWTALPVPAVHWIAIRVSFRTDMRMTLTLLVDALVGLLIAGVVAVLPLLALMVLLGLF